ncbi:MAG TPA: hypothetical protein VJR25_07170, partial [Microbacterium sp.]|uniref:hypothetical protein n=1 Tax=Microbacterium sp. TaxID=51671 RepID=UPI002B4A127B
SSDYIGIAEDEEHVRLTLAILERKRSLMIRLRDQHVISDTTLRILQTRLDRDALRLSRPHLGD